MSKYKTKKPKDTQEQTKEKTAKWWTEEIGKIRQQENLQNIVKHKRFRRPDNLYQTK